MCATNRWVASPALAILCTLGGREYRIYADTWRDQLPTYVGATPSITNDRTIDAFPAYGLPHL